MKDSKVCNPHASIANDNVPIDRLEKVYFCPAKVSTHTVAKMLSVQYQDLPSPIPL